MRRGNDNTVVSVQNMKFMGRQKGNEKGITLIELSIVLTIAGILSSLAFVGPEFIRSERIIGTTKQLLGDLQRARQDAMIRSIAINSRGFGIRFADKSSYVIFEFDDCNNNSVYDLDGCDGNREEANITTKDLTSSIELLVNGANPILIFDNLGVPREDDWDLWNNGGGTLLVQHQTDNAVTKRCISIGISRIREGVWDDTNCQEQ